MISSLRWTSKRLSLIELLGITAKLWYPDFWCMNRSSQFKEITRKNEIQRAPRNRDSARVVYGYCSIRQIVYIALNNISNGRRKNLLALKRSSQILSIYRNRLLWLPLIKIVELCVYDRITHKQRPHDLINQKQRTAIPAWFFDRLYKFADCCIQPNDRIPQWNILRCGYHILLPYSLQINTTQYCSNILVWIHKRLKFGHVVLTTWCTYLYDLSLDMVS